VVITPERLSAVIGEVYAAVGVPNGFDVVLRRIRTLLNGSSGMLFTPFTDRNAGGFGFVDHIVTDLFGQYRDYYFDKDPWAREGRQKHLLGTGRTSTDEVLISQSALQREVIYSDYLTRLNTIRGCFTIVVGDDDPILPRTHLSIYRGVGSRPFSNSERRALELLSPHVLQALRLAYRLEFAEETQASALDVLQQLRCGVVLVDRDRHIVFMNRAAERLCTRERGLLTWKRSPNVCELRAALSREDVTLQRAIDSALRISASQSDEPASAAGPVAVHGMHGRGTLILTTLPLPQTLHDPARSQAKVVIFVEDPVAKLSSGNRIFTVLFGFTPAEVRVAEALLLGESPKKIADRFAITENTVRTQIRSLYDKTSMRGMAALIGLLTRFCESRASDGPVTTEEL